jgi:coproporphyrinogen III oxidase
MQNSATLKEFKERWIEYIYDLREKICSALSEEDGKEIFDVDKWDRAEGKDGGGITRTMANGNVIEKGGVNTSVVYGEVTDQMRSQLQMEGVTWFACGLSLVIHPRNPFVPTVHANWRYFELYDEEKKIIDRWFGGGTDLTPYYLFEEDAKHFHQTIKNVIDPFGTDLYSKYKKWCDVYFVNAHRNNEMRGIGGVFYDHLRPSTDEEAEQLFNFQKAVSGAFIDAYLPIVKKRKNMTFNESQTEWQEIRRGRYVEFNLIHDRGTLFGLKTNGRTESILMSLPPRARWLYNHQPGEGSEEYKLLQSCLHPREWVNA